jgi:hypothetical protein
MPILGQPPRWLSKVPTWISERVPHNEKERDPEFHPLPLVGVAFLYVNNENPISRQKKPLLLLEAGAFFLEEVLYPLSGPTPINGISAKEPVREMPILGQTPWCHV